MSEVTEEDADFLSLVEAAEAAFIASAPKRQKLSSSADAGRPAVEEGAYMAALRGSYSPLWQEQQNQLKHGQKNSGDGLRGGSNPSASLSSSTAGGACFKCGSSGHWARDCDVGGGRGRGNGSVSGGASVAGKDSEVPEKACPCGSGTCLVLTSNTAKNPGRKFYRCPLRMENEGCNFFEWCDDSLSRMPSARHVLNNQPSLLVSGIQCPCGGGSCLVLATKSGKNMGQQYYRCPLVEGHGYCGFFKWCDDQGTTISEHAFASKDQGVGRNSSSQLSGERTNSVCFKCGQGGHWSRECPNQSSVTYGDTAGKHLGSTASTTCFKCGKSGHWAQKCPGNDLAPASATCRKRSF